MLSNYRNLEKFNEKLQIKIQEIQKRISINYERYINHKFYTSKNLTSEFRLTNIYDIAYYFRLPLDTNRLDDYALEEFDLDSLSIVIRDKKTDTLYKARFLYKSHIEKIDDGYDRFDVARPYFSFINVTIINNTYIKELSYYVSIKTPVIERITLEKKYEEDKLKYFKDLLVITKINDNVINYTIKDDYYKNCIRIEYKKVIDCTPFDRKEVILYQKEYSVTTHKNGKVSSNEKISVYPDSSKNTFDRKYIIDENNYVSYYVSKVNKPDDGCDFCGWCLENGYISTDRPDIIYNMYNPYAFSKLQTSESDSNKVSSSITFVMHDDYNNKNNRLNEYMLEIYKIKSQITINYYIIPVKLFSYKMNYKNFDAFKLSYISDKKGKLSINEIKTICNKISSVNTNDFIGKCLDELNNFIDLLNLRDGNKDKMGLLDGSTFFNLSIDDIAIRIDSNPLMYFEVIEDEFNSVYDNENINETCKKLTLKK